MERPTTLCLNQDLQDLRFSRNSFQSKKNSPHDLCWLATRNELNLGSPTCNVGFTERPNHHRSSKATILLESGVSGFRDWQDFIPIKKIIPKSSPQ
jgi:hypothetical protein